jgi:hypothetical protein
MTTPTPASTPTPSPTPSPKAAAPKADQTSQSTAVDGKKSELDKKKVDVFTKAYLLPQLGESATADEFASDMKQSALQQGYVATAEPTIVNTEVVKLRRSTSVVYYVEMSVKATSLADSSEREAGSPASAFKDPAKAKEAKAE